MAREPVIFHMDLDAFFAAAEVLDHPEWQGLPVIVGALPGQRGVVSTCSYEARKFGVRSAMSVTQAYALCPKGIFTAPRMDRYSELSHKVMAQLNDFSPEVHQVSVDEAFINMTGTEGLFGPPEAAAQKIKDQIFHVTGLKCSIGIGPNHYLAKIASDWKKPDGLFRIVPDQVIPFLDALPLKKLHGAGKKTQERLAQLGITSVPELRAYPLEMLQSMMGKANGQFLFNAARGLESSHYLEPVKNHSASTETTFQEDTRNLAVLRRKLLEMSHELMFRLLDEKKQSRTLSIKIRLEDFTTTSAQVTMKGFFANSQEIFSQALGLFQKKWDRTQAIRLIGLGLDNLENAEGANQIDLFDSPNDRLRNLEKAILKIRSKGIRITKAGLWKKDSQDNP